MVQGKRTWKKEKGEISRHLVDCFNNGNNGHSITVFNLYLIFISFQR